MSRFAVKLYRDVATSEKPAGIPDDWPAETNPLEQSEDAPTGYTAMTDAELDAHRATHQSAFDAWDASRRQAIADSEAAQRTADSDDDTQINAALALLVTAQQNNSAQLGLTNAQLRRVLIFLLRLARHVINRLGRR